jgi:AraC-like DNA-binding protein
MTVIFDRLSDHLRDSAASGAPFFVRSISLVTDPVQAREFSSTFVERDYHEVIFFLEGDGDVSVLDREGNVRLDSHRPGCLYLYRPQDRRCRWPSFGPAPLTFLQVGFPSDEWRTFLRLAGYDPNDFDGTAPVTKVIDPHDAEIRECFDVLLDSGRSLPAKLGLILLWTQVLSRLVPDNADAPRPAPRWLLHSIDAMYDDANLRHGVPRLLELAHVSSRQLSRATRRHFGESPSNIVADLRLRRAKELLSTTFDGIGSIATQCGFASPGHFSARFRAATGISPREYRNRSSGGLAAPR